MLTEYLKPEKITIYTRQPLGDLMLKNKIRKDPKGNIEVFEVFWKFEYEWTYKNLVPPILIYADLMATGDQSHYRLIQDMRDKKYHQNDFDEILQLLEHLKTGILERLK